MSDIPITILLTCTERRLTLDYCLPYYSEKNLEVHLLDSSQKVWDKKKDYPKIKYFHYPPSMCTMYEMFHHHIQNHVRTEYICWCNDDDLVTYEGLLAASEFYKKDIKKEYSNVYGLHILVNNPKVTNNNHYGDFDNIRPLLKSKDPIERLNYIFNKGFYTPHSVIRTEVYKRANNIIIESMQNKKGSLAPIRFYDKILTFIAALYGNKYSQLPVLFLIRTSQFERMVSSNKYKFPSILERHIPFKQIHDRLKHNNLLAKELHTINPHLSMNNCIEVTKNILNLKGVHSIVLNSKYQKAITQIILTCESFSIFKQLYKNSWS